MALKKFRNIYIFTDLCTAFTGWIIFNWYQSLSLGPDISGFSTLFHSEFKIATHSLLILLFWFVLYYSTGYYSNVLRKLKLEDFSQTFLITFLGTCILFIFFIHDDYSNAYKRYYGSFLVLFIIHFHLTLIPRLLITSYITRLEKDGKIKFKTIFIGRIEKINQIWKDLNLRYSGHGHRVIGYISFKEKDGEHEDSDLVKLGELSEVHDLVKQKQPDDIIIALEERDVDIYRQIIFDLNSANVVVKVNPELYPIVKGQAIISSLFRYPLIDISRSLLKPWQASLKQLIDLLGATIGLLISLPVFLFVIVGIKLSSKGPVFYSHERIGRFGKPFRIWKFRSMYNNAEENGPQLATTIDPRVTPFGRFMRRLKLDEIPNLFNVLKGEMSLVGPRPERKFYIDQIIKRAPEYTRLLKVKPGVTSWGQVKYGYAENVDEMVRRMHYDLLYIDNMSLYVDFQILVRTFLIIVRGQSK